MTKYINEETLRKLMYEEAFEKDSDMQKWDSGCWIRYKLFENCLEAVPAEDVVEVRHGRWIWLEEDEDDFETDIVECSYCRKSYTTLFSKESFFETFKYCPNCGAKMDEGQDE